MTSLAVTPFDDKTIRAVRRRFWLTTAALGRPESNKTQVIFILRREDLKVLMDALRGKQCFGCIIWYRHLLPTYMCCMWHLVVCGCEQPVCLDWLFFSFRLLNFSLTLLRHSLPCLLSYGASVYLICSSIPEAGLTKDVLDALTKWHL